MDVNFSAKCLQQGETTCPVVAVVGGVLGQLSSGSVTISLGNREDVGKIRSISELGYRGPPKLV